MESVAQGRAASAPPPSDRRARAALRLIGRVDDAELAAEVGLTVSAVTARRLQKGIVFRSVRRWTRAEEEIVQRHPIEEARRLGRTETSILHRRAKLGPPSPAAGVRKRPRDE